MKHSKKRIQNYGNRTYIPLHLVFHKQAAPLRRPDMPRCIKRYGVKQEEDSDYGSEEEWGLNEVKPFEQLVQEMKEGGGEDELKPRSM